MPSPAKDGSGQIKTYISNAPELGVDIIAEQIQKEHIADNVPKAAVQESVTNKLPRTQMVRMQHKLLGPRPQNPHNLMCDRVDNR